ncbi:MAG: hypothetical protein QF441_17005 [Bacteriovoracaceae bacterium]|nr:hypothetical protein [Bacteriovoracaceae bacterium]
MLSKIIGFIICFFALVLPWRIRIIFAELIGWIVQGFYYAYYGIFNYILKELKKAQEENKVKDK